MKKIRYQPGSYSLHVSLPWILILFMVSVWPVLRDVSQTDPLAFEDFPLCIRAVNELLSVLLSDLVACRPCTF